ncbi:hypothetical protein ACFFSY_10490 [Paenibacillus aurantiacus]|uniref:PQQ-binding-like beta-propeller repeat protein n=1 Tax=Paenibacillus aurantiacus TaxID=1936118 RepID=A0ABV5KM79_9BACL
MMKKWTMLLLSVLIVCVGASSISAAAPSSYSESLLDPSTQSLAISSSKTLFVDKKNRQIQMLDLNTGKIGWKQTFPSIYDVEVLTYPTKIVVITEEKRHPRKVTLSEEGKPLSQQTYNNMKLTGTEKIQWSAPLQQEKEKLAIFTNKALSVYQYPWSKPSVTLSLEMADDNKYENVILQDAQLRAPYAIAKFSGSSLGQSKPYYKIVNVAAQQISALPLAWNVESGFILEGTSLALHTSSISGSPLGIETNMDQMIYARYDLLTGKLAPTITRTFTMSDSNWSTTSFNGYLLLTDTEHEQRAIFNKSGELLTEREATQADLNSRLVGYSNGHAYTLVRTANKTIELQVD